MSPVSLISVFEQVHRNLSNLRLATGLLKVSGSVIFILIIDQWEEFILT
jgi:hypothetical protein